MYVTGARSWPKSLGTSVWAGALVGSSFLFELKFLQSDPANSYSRWPVDKLDYSAVGLDVGYWDGGYYTFGINAKNPLEAGGSGNFFLHVTRNGGEKWESPFTEYRDGCNTDDKRSSGERWSSTGLEMTSFRHLKFNPYNLTNGFASVADINMLRTLDGGESFEISNTGLISINTLYDYTFVSASIVIAVGGNFHDWPHGWYKNVIRGAGGVFISFDCGSTWRRLGKPISSNCSNELFETDCSVVNDYLGQDMIRQTLSVLYDPSSNDGTVYIGTQSAGIAQLKGLQSAIDSGFVDIVDNLEWEWINTGLGNVQAGLLVPELKLVNNKLYALLSGDAPSYSNNQTTGIYVFDSTATSWKILRGTVIRPSNVAPQFTLLLYPVSFDVDPVTGTLWMVDYNAGHYNYLAPGIWKSTDNGETWNRMMQVTHPHQIRVVDSRVYVCSSWSISRWGAAAPSDSSWGYGGMFHSDDAGLNWIRNENIPLLANGAGVTIDPQDPNKLFYSFFGGGMLKGPIPQ